MLLETVVRKRGLRIAASIDPDGRRTMHWLANGSITAKAVHGASAGIRHVAASVWI